jgi:hypothetical protein
MPVFNHVFEQKSLAAKNKTRNLLAKTVICKIRNLDGTFFEIIRRFCLALKIRLQNNYQESLKNPVAKLSV